MTDISIDPTTPTAGNGATVTVRNSDCNPFTIRVVCLDDDPPSLVEEQDNNSNPPPAEMLFVPLNPGTYRAEVVCGGTVTERKTFSVT